MKTRDEAIAETTVRLYALNPTIKQWNGEPYDLSEVPTEYHAKLARRQALALLDNGLLAVEPEHRADNWQSRKCWLDDHKTVWGVGAHVMCFLWN